MMIWFLQRFVWAAGGALGGYLVGRYLTRDLRASMASVGDELPSEWAMRDGDPRTRALYFQQQAAWAAERARDAVKQMNASPHDARYDAELRRAWARAQDETILDGAYP
jgi:chemotaxis regulatin CheY-phosphate phosphatase CheZ